LSARTWMAAATVALVAVLGLAVVATGSAAPAKKGATPLKVAVVTDIGGLNDKGFNASAYNGLKVAQRQYGVQGRVFASKTGADYIPNLTTAARQGYDLVIAVGFLMGDATAAVAKQFPKTKFAIVDVSAPTIKGKPKNVRGILFAEQEAGCLAGVAAASASKSGTISSVGGLKLPAVDAYIAGYQYCAKKVNPNIKTLNGYSQDFNDQAKCKEVALNQIGQGSDVVFQVAGGCGLGAIAAAKDSKGWGIGVDNDQSFLGTHVLTSALKKVDAGVTQTIKLTKDGKYKGGVDSVFNVKNGGVGYGKVSVNAPKRAALIAKLNSYAKQLASGSLKPPRTISG
jgi:basic membrane protein A